MQFYKTKEWWKNETWILPKIGSLSGFILVLERNSYGTLGINRFNSLTTKSRRQNFRLQIFKKC